MAKREPFNIAFLDIDKVIKDEQLQEVTCEFIRESSSNKFHPDGLFSERIFGDIATERRLKRCGYINLHCHVLHPIVYQNLYALKRFYTEIMAGTSYALWDGDQGDFVRASEMEEGADTGYCFFMKHFDKIDFKKNQSLKRSDRIDVIMKFKKIRVIDKFIVIPAGLRDIKEEGSRVEKDSINSLYASLLRNAKSMTPGSDTNPLFDSVHYAVQKKVNEIYDHISNLVKGKGGFFEGRYNHRSIARGTRNVITASDMDAPSPESPQYHKITETKVPLFQASKAAADYMVYWIKTMFFDQVINPTSENIAVINPENLNLEYVTIDTKTKDAMSTTEGIEKIIDRFRDPFNRFKPVKITIDKKDHYLFMVYDRGDMVNIIRNVSEFKTELTSAGIQFDETKLRPMQLAEMLYIAAYCAYRGVHATVTRYPITDEQSIYVSSTHLMTTSPSRIVRLLQGPEADPTDLILPEYPIEGNKFIDALMLHPTRLKSLCADFDGNCVSGDSTVDIRFPICWTEECRNIVKHLDHYKTREGKKHINDVLNRLHYMDKNSYINDGYYYTNMRIDMFPAIGPYVLDKHGARVYDVPSGVEVLSYFQEHATYLPIQKFTVEPKCETVECIIGGRIVRVSTNKSLAQFNHSTGGLDKTEPRKMRQWGFVPVICKPAKFANKKLTGHVEFSRGYNSLIKAVSFTNIDQDSLRLRSDEYVIGIIAAIIDRFGEMQEASTILYLTDNNMPSVHVYVDNDFELSCLLRILHMAGIMWNYPTNKNGKTCVGIRFDDLWKYSDVLKFRNKKNAGILKQCKAYVEQGRFTEVTDDIIPVTVKEKKRLSVLTDVPEAESLSKKFRNPSIWYYSRKMIMDQIHPHDGTKLSERAGDKNIEWVLSTVLPDTKKKCTVYDFVVADSKVYAVNNGVIVFDTCSWIPVFSKEANEEIDKYMKTKGNYILPSGDTLPSMFDDLIGLNMLAMTRDVPELKK